MAYLIRDLTAVLGLGVLCRRVPGGIIRIEVAGEVLEFRLSPACSVLCLDDGDEFFRLVEEILAYFCGRLGIAYEPYAWAGGTYLAQSQIHKMPRS